MRHLAQDHNPVPWWGCRFKMRITSLRVWLNHAVRESVGAARRVGHAIHKRIRPGSGKVEVGVGVGDDESRFGGGRTQVWFVWLEEAREQVLRFFEKSTFERFPRFEGFLRRLLGRPKPVMLPQPKPGPGPKVKLGAHSLAPGTAEAERLKAEIRQTMMKAHTSENAGLRDEQARRRAPKDDDHS